MGAEMRPRGWSETGGEVSEGVGTASAGANGKRGGRRSRRVLVVDDCAQSARCLAEILNLWGHETRLAYDGVEALDLARAYRPEVILLDITLPRLDGFGVARALRDDPRFLATIVIAMTGHGSEEDRSRAAEAGFDRHLLKPVDLDALEDLLDHGQG